MIFQILNPRQVRSQELQLLKLQQAVHFSHPLPTPRVEDEQARAGIGEEAIGSREGCQQAATTAIARCFHRRPRQWPCSNLRQRPPSDCPGGILRSLPVAHRGSYVKSTEWTGTSRHSTDRLRSPLPPTNQQLSYITQDTTEVRAQH